MANPQKAVGRGLLACLIMYCVLASPTKEDEAIFDNITDQPYLWVDEWIASSQAPRKDGEMDQEWDKTKRVQLLAEPLIKVGDDLLSHFRSTIGAGRLNFSVRNGKRWNPAAIVTLRTYPPFFPLKGE